MPLSPDEIARLHQLNIQSGRGVLSPEAEFRQLQLDRRVDRLMNAARNARASQAQVLMVPSAAELNYRAGISPPTSIDRPENLTQFLNRQPPRPIDLYPTIADPWDDVHFQPRPDTASPQPPRPATAPPRPIDPFPTIADPWDDVPPRPRPSGASPPSTPNTSGGARPPINMGDTPTSAAPRSPAVLSRPMTAPPSSSPGPAGVGSGGIAGGFAIGGLVRIVSGQPLEQAIMGGSLEVVGTVAGGVIGGSLLGPPGAFAGGLVGGFAAGQLSDFLYRLVHPPRAEPPSELVTAPPPFTGGQQSGVVYRVTNHFWEAGFDYSGFRTSDHFGPITNYVLRDSFADPGNGIWHYGVRDQFGSKTTGGEVSERTSQGHPPYISSAVRVDGLPDTAGNPAPGPLPTDNRAPDSYNHPGNQDIPPSAAPAAGNSNSDNRRNNAPGNNDYFPGGTASRNGGSPRGDSDNWMPHGGPGGSPHPDNTPPPHPAPLPDIRTAPPPLPFADPGDSAFPGGSGSSQTHGGTFSAPNPVPLTSPSGEPTLVPFPSGAPVTTNLPDGSTLVNPNGLLSNPQVTAPTPIPVTTPTQPVPDSVSPTPITAPPGTGPNPAPTPENQGPELKDLKDRINEIGLGLVGLTLLVKGLQAPINTTAQNTTPQNLENAAKNGTCQTVEPGGCLTPLANNAAAAANNSAGNSNKLDGINAALQAGDLGLGADTNSRVRNLENKTGAHDYPLILPEYLLDDQFNRTVTIFNQVQFNVWLLKQIDALVGLFPIKIERTDEDNKKQTLVFENIAEAIAEITGLLANIAFDADTAVNVATRATGEAVGAKAAALQAGSYLKAIVDYMGFQGQAVSIDVPISVTPGAVGLDGKLQESELKDFLKPSIQKAIGFKNTDPVDQRLTLRRILESGEISRAALFRPLKSDPTKNTLTGDAIKADRAAEKKRVDDAWEAFKLRMEGHTGGTKVDIDDGIKPPD